MAVARILKLTQTEALVKIDGAIGAVTINLATDLKLAAETASTPAVNIVAMKVTGKPGGVASVARNSVNLWDLSADADAYINLHEFGGVVDTTNNTHNIVVTTTGNECQLLLKLRKVSGYIQ